MHLMRSLSLLSLVLLVAGCPSGSGSQGPQGDQGPIGPTGAAGPAGAKGDKGDKGDPGAMGAMGTTGATGATGATGPQGVQGAPGQVLVLDGGAVNGPPGASVVVTPEGPSATCPAGGLRVTQVSDGGISVVCNGLSVAVTALAPLSTQCPAGGVLLGLPDGGATALCNGAQGPQGNVGPAGGVGPAGPAGPMGPMGAAGPMGLVGAQGPAGPMGPAGGTGPSGPMGAQGTVGAQGPAGPVGPAGGVGAAGPTGPAGPQGPQGPAGAVLLLDGGVAGANGRIEFAGFTSVSYNGALGGIPGANALCSAEFAGSYFCPESDFRLSESSAAPGPSGAWVDDSRSTTTGLRTTFRCDNATGVTWTFSGASDNGDSMSTTGNTSFATCDLLKPLACCRRSGRTVVRGLTSATFNGDLGGIPGANAKCSAQYPGSFFCAENDYRDAESPVTPPAMGAWLDDTRSSTTGLRTTFRCDNATGTTWTFAGASDNGDSMSPTGGVAFATCDQVKPLLCCQYR